MAVVGVNRNNLNQFSAGLCKCDGMYCMCVVCMCMYDCMHVCMTYMYGRTVLLGSVVGLVAIGYWLSIINLVTSLWRLQV